MSKIKRIFSIILIASLFLTFSFNGNYIFAQNNKKFKVIGYYSELLFDDPVDANVQFDKLTHIMYAFLIPREDGSLVKIAKPERLKEIVEKGHKQGVKIFIAIGGWADENGGTLDPRFEKMAASDEARKAFVENVSKFVDQYNLDGVEIDWEYPDEGESSKNYEKLVVELSNMLKSKNKSLTAALNGAWSKTEGPSVSKAVTDKCLKSFDFISVMSYDVSNEDHSPFWHADTSIQYWTNRGVKKEDIVLGIPLYAKPSWKQYRHLVAESRENAYKDFVKGDPLDSYYNGINTIKEKTRLSLKNAGGVMLFDVNEDTTDDLSIVRAINDVVNEFNSISKEEFNNKMYFIINNHELTFSKDENMGIPFIDKKNRTLIPVRKPLESIGAKVEFKNNVVVAIKDDIKLEIPIDKDYIRVNDKEIKMDTKAVIKDNRTYIPLRYVFEAFNYKIDWHEASKTVIAKNKN